MSKLEELMAELCPEGVAYKTIGEIATDVFRGAGITRDQVREIGTPCVRYGEIYTTYGVWFEDCVSHTDETLLTSKKYFGYGDILFAITGESVEDIAKCCAYIGHETCLAGGDIVVLKHNEDPKYLSYALSTLDAQKQKSKGKVKSKVVHSSVPDIKAIRIPVPPLPVQREIVRILDNFTELTAELAAELAARKKQYAYYRDKLLTMGTEQVAVCNLGDIADIYTGSKPNEILDTISDYEYINAGTGNSGYTEQPNCEGDTVTTPSRGQGGIGYVGYQSKPFYLGPLCYAIRSKTQEFIINKYIYHWLVSHSSDILVLKNEGGTPALNKTDLAKIRIKVPPLSVQNRLVEVLDNFDAICTDLSSGLPAEIEARQKQYEYYRDKLLTFKTMSN